MSNSCDRKDHCDNCNCDKYNFCDEKFYDLIDYYLSKDMVSIRRLLLPFKNKKIQIITEATPPAGKPPNITGTLMYVDNKILKLRLKSETEGSTKEGIYFLKSILGFIPLGEEDSGGCEKETNPLTSPFSQFLGKRVNLIVSSSSSTSIGTNVIGTVLEVTNDFLKIQLDQTTATTNPLIATYPLTQIVGIVDLTSSKTSKGNSSKGKGSNHNTSESETSKGEITVQVTVYWSDSTIHPDEVNINFIRDDIVTTIRTIGGIATFAAKATGNLIIEGESIPGFTVPIKEIKITPTLPFVYETLTYSVSEVPVTNINLTPATLSLLPTDKFKLTAAVVPANANNQDIIWNSDRSDIANVDSSGVVTAYEEGIAIISATSAESPYITAITTVTVTDIQSIVAPPPISAVLGEVVILPSTVAVYLSNGSTMYLPVTWEYDGYSVGSTFTIPSDSTLTLYTLTGTLEKTDLTTTLNINVDTDVPIAIPVTGLTLNTISTSIYVGDIINIEPIVTPENATTKDVLWSSLDSSIATVNNGTVIGIAPGLTIITATTVDGNFKAYCQVSVSSVPEIDLIYSVQTVYDSREDVVINVENLVAARVQSPKDYYIKVEQTGSSPLLGKGNITLTPGMTEFNLYAFTNFDLSDNFNNEYFVFMSTDETFPKSDEQTLSTNFKIGSAVPTVSTGNIQVDLSTIGGTLDNNPSNIIFILAREIDKPIEDITWKDYVIDPNIDPSEVEFIDFTDEVKLKGKTNSDGIVIWEEPKEKLKLGGYVLLEVTPNGYIDNLNLINPESSDGDLIKVIQLTRDGIIIRHIINTATQ